MDSLSHAHALKNGFVCYWRIEDFTLCKPNKDFVLHSERFEIDMMRSSEWHFEIQQTSSRTLSVYLFKDEGGCCKYNSINYSVSLLTDSGWTVLTKDKSKIFKSEGPGFGMPHFIKWRDITKEHSMYFPSKALTISFRIWNVCMGEEAVYCLMSSRMINERDIVYFSFQISSKLDSMNFKKICASISTQTDETGDVPNDIEFISVNTQTEVVGDSNVFNNLDDFLFLFKEKGFKYVVLRTGEKEFYAHRALLGTMSPVFEYIFSKDTKGIDSEVCIKDIESDTLMLMLKFIHLEHLGEMKWGEVVKLFYAANAYQIEQLINICVLFLKKYLTEKTVCEVFDLADLYKNEGLKKIAQEYFCENSKTILRTSEFQDFLFKKTKLASEILCKLADRL